MLFSLLASTATAAALVAPAPGPTSAPQPELSKRHILADGSTNYAGACSYFPLSSQCSYATAPGPLTAIDCVDGLFGPVCDSPWTFVTTCSTYLTTSLSTYWWFGIFTATNNVITSTCGPFPVNPTAVVSAKTSLPASSPSKFVPSPSASAVTGGALSSSAPAASTSSVRTSASSSVVSVAASSSSMRDAARSSTVSSPIIVSSSSSASLPSSTASASSSASASAFSYYGCYQDYYPNARTLDGPSLFADNMTPERCQAFCSAYSLFGVENGRECYCGNALTQCATKQPEGACYFGCSGDSSKSCGGNNVIGVYALTSAGVPKTTGCAVLPADVPYTHLACIQDYYPNYRAMQGFSYADSNNTQAGCRVTCAMSGYGYAGLENGKECYCANTVAPYFPIDDRFCNTPCAANSSSTCGGSNTLDVFSLTQNAAVQQPINSCRTG